MKTVKIFPLLLLMFSVIGCSDFLEQESPNINADNFYNDVDNAKLAVTAVYDVLTYEEDQLGGHVLDFMWGDMLAWDSEKGSDPSDQGQLNNMREWRALATNRNITGLWTKSYKGIYRANEVITKLEALTYPDREEDKLRQQYIGEAKFLRAYYYVSLVRLYGGVPLITKPLVPSEFGALDRASFAEVFAQIETDLLDAVALLPNRYAAEDTGRATKGAARAYLARAYMFQLGTHNENQVTWNDVYEQTSAIVASGVYNLVPNYATMFEFEGENSSESVFEVQCVVGTEGYSSDRKTGTLNTEFQGNREAGIGWGFNKPTQALYDIFEDGDPRRACTIIANNDIIYGTAQVVDAGYYNRKVHMEPEFDKIAGKSSGWNIRQCRYADVMLMHAEAAYHMGQEGVARDMVNQIRARARVSTLSKGSIEGSMDYADAGAQDKLAAISSTGTQLLEDILMERKYELSMESVSYYDLVRTGKYYDVLPTEVRANAEAKSMQGNVNNLPLLPIPDNEVRAWNLEQNQGYGGSN
ncbi:RagB/SusD family nutrient uptake outer membrane protein [Sediminitomix flava]|uniref:SusD-like starch-binding protein associating with outer membrane n=1 Tax=Sediminitomix flava TaxID=379075 RepID=A0A315ZIE9_SEDFL|nr:RagB/SusD family nutrient uptake outer membrane protein [Sediminitomix flava]PWJ44598.1 SusD-like starch-binding protein associating with outer membrane [Sediminitomix flava]